MQGLESKSFKKGMREVAHGKYMDLKSALMKVIGIASEPSWRKYRDGRTELLDVNLAAEIEATFVAFGVKHPWGE